MDTLRGIDKKKAIAENSARWYRENKEKKLKYAKDWYKENKGMVTKREKDRRDSNRDFYNKISRDYKANNKEAVSLSNKLYYEKNKEKISARRKKNFSDPENKKKVAKYMQFRRKNHEQYKIKNNISRIMRARLKKRGGQKAGEVISLLGFTFNELKNRLISTLPLGRTWQDFIEGHLDIDHIIPDSLYSYNCASDNEFRMCWDLRNLRLLDSNENRFEKRDKFIPWLVCRYGIRDLLPRTLSW